MGAASNPNYALALLQSDRSSVLETAFLVCVQQFLALTAVHHNLGQHGGAFLFIVQVNPAHRGLFLVDLKSKYFVRRINIVCLEPFAKHEVVRLEISLLCHLVELELFQIRFFSRAQRLH